MSKKLPLQELGMTQEGRETYHVETGETYELACWCSMGRDHTFPEWLAAEGATPPELHKRHRRTPEVLANYGTKGES